MFTSVKSLNYFSTKSPSLSVHVLHLRVKRSKTIALFFCWISGAFFQLVVDLKTVYSDFIPYPT
jgi:hypothetical protein